MKKSQIFNTVPVRRPKRNHFDLSHETKMTGRMGRLMPFMCIDTVPGDIFRNSSEIMLRMAPMLAPIMHRVDVTTHFFFVPNRLIWDEWPDFITGGEAGTSEPVSPYVTFAQLAAQEEGYMETSTLWNYLGLPALSDNADSTQIPISSLPFRAYQLIYNEYYRDQNLETPLDIPKTSGQEITGSLATLFTIRDRAWEKDYFTSALPWTQRGVEAALPFEINYKPISDVVSVGGTDLGDLQILSGDGNIFAQTPPVGVVSGRIENLEDEGFSVTINELRRSIRLQEWLEANARGGARYTEQIYVHFSERVPDYRLQRPEYLGGGKQAVVISEVLAKAGTDAQENANVGDMAGHGLSVGRSNRFSYKCVEHGWIIGLMSIVPRSAYFRGVPRKFLRTDKFDYYWKEFANLGEQAIQNIELVSNSGDDEFLAGTFGYTPRYAEYKYENDRIVGDFTNNLQYWHLGRDITGEVTLTSDFVMCNTDRDDLNRIFYVTDDIDNLWIQIFNHLTAKRPMPYFGVPTI